MGRKVAAAALALMASRVEGHGAAPLYDSVVLNVGISCEWQQSCEHRQLRAMQQARKFIEKAHPPLWRIHLCNRNASRGASRVDWVGFNNCVRNAELNAQSHRRR